MQKGMTRTNNDTAILRMKYQIIFVNFYIGFWTVTGHLSNMLSIGSWTSGPKLAFLMYN